MRLLDGKRDGLRSVCISKVAKRNLLENNGDLLLAIFVPNGSSTFTHCAGVFYFTVPFCGLVLKALLDRFQHLHPRKEAGPAPRFSQDRCLAENTWNKALFRFA